MITTNLTKRFEDDNFFKYFAQGFLIFFTFGMIKFKDNIKNKNKNNIDKYWENVGNIVGKVYEAETKKN